MVELAKKSSTTGSLPLNCPRSERGDGGSKSSNTPGRRKRESVCGSPEGRGGSGTLPLNFRFHVGGLRRLRPHSPKSFAGRGGRGEEGLGGTSGLEKEGEGQAAGERLERPGERLGTPRLARRRGRLGQHWGGDTPAFARGGEPFAVCPLPEPRPGLCWEWGAQCRASVLPPLA